MLSLFLLAFLAADAVKVTQPGTSDAVSAQDLRRHRMAVPGAHLQASTADEVHAKLNAALMSGPVKMPQHSPCETYTIKELSELQKAMFKHRAAVLLTSTDGRAPRHRTLDALEDELARNEVYVRDHPHVADAVRDGLCNSIALSWVHHLTDTGRSDFSSHRLPLLSLMTAGRWAEKLGGDQVAEGVTASTPCEEGHNSMYSPTFHEGLEGSMSWPMEGEYYGTAYVAYPFWPIVVDGEEINRTAVSRNESAHDLYTIWSKELNARRMTHSVCHLEELGLGWTEDGSCTLLMKGSNGYLYDSQESNCCIAGDDKVVAAPEGPGTGSTSAHIYSCNLNPLFNEFPEWFTQTTSTTNKSQVFIDNYVQDSGHYAGPARYSTARWGFSWFYYVTDLKGTPLEYGEGPCEYPLSWTCSSYETSTGIHNGWNSRDFWPDTFRQRPVSESEFQVPSVCLNTKNYCRFQYPCAVVLD
jgi:hypothetical protein